MAQTVLKARFEREIHALGMVQGPHVSALTASAKPDEAPQWFATEYVQGMTLSEYVKEKGPLTLPMAASLGILLAEALSEIHGAGIRHPDFKPGNILLGPDGPKVIDFGLAALAESAEGADITKTQDILGTPAAWPPSRAVHPRTSPRRSTSTRSAPCSRSRRRCTIPHDSMFRRFMRVPGNAASELRAVLPSSLTKRLDLEGLVEVPGTFVDEALRQRHTDVLFSVPLDGQDAFMHVLIEHQSTSDPVMAYRMGNYMFRIWSHYLDQNPGARSLPRVIPLVVYNGRTPWSAPRRLEDLIVPDSMTGVRLRICLGSPTTSTTWRLSVGASCVTGTWCPR